MIRQLIRLWVLVLFMGFLAVLTVCNGRLYVPVPPRGELTPEILPHLSYLRGALEDGTAEDMQSLFPEGYYFSYVLYGLSWVEAGLQSPQGSEVHQQALDEARRALQHLDSPAGTAVFSPTLDPPYGMFYAAWRNYLLAGILHLQPPAALDVDELADFQAKSQTLAEAIERSPTPFLPSYPGQAWPVDTFPGIVSLKAYSHLVNGRFELLIATWLEDVKTHVDPATGLVPHRTDPLTGQTLDGARATSQTLILRFLADIEPEWGEVQYQLFRQRYVMTRLGLPGVLEFPPERGGQGDVDSGPLLGGVSLSATAVFLGTSRLYGDREVETAVWQGGEALGGAITTGVGRRYALGALPIGDEFVVWSKATAPWFAPIQPTSYSAILPFWWRWPSHLISLGLLLLVGSFTRLIWRKLAK